MTGGAARFTETMKMATIKERAISEGDGRQQGGVGTLTSLELPRTGAEAATLARGPGSVVLAGGATVMPRILKGGPAWTRVVALRRSALDGIHHRGERIEVGATTTLHELGVHPDLGFLDSAIRSTGSADLRNLATVGGILLSRSLMAIWPYACWLWMPRCRSRITWPGRRFPWSNCSWAQACLA
jgi:xanthine dehydrogenase iron-sulfur cluster and FAD-binding subunit A